MNRNEIHKLVDELPEKMLPLLEKVLKESMSERSGATALDKDTYAFLLEDEDNWWKKTDKVDSQEG